MLRRVPYPLLCALLGFALGWLPMLFHGPIPEKYNIHYIRGAVAVWGWYVARELIGLLVGITAVPARWYLRGPLCGLLMLVPLGFVSLATPECGPTCMFWNCVTAMCVGLTVAGLAYLITGRDHRFDRSNG
jgi:hypothetical protein